MSSEIAPLNTEYFDELDAFIDAMRLTDAESRQAALIEVLHRAQDLFGYLPDEVQEFVAAKLKLPLSHVHGVITFYHYFTTTPRGKHQISICLGTACFVRGAERVIAEFERLLEISMGEVTPCGRFSLAALRCVGACSLAPVVMIGDRTYGNVTPEQVAVILAEYDEQDAKEQS